MNPTAAHSNLLTHIHKIGLTHIYRFKKILLKKPNVKIVFQNEIVKESLMNLPMSDQLEHDFKTLFKYLSQWRKSSQEKDRFSLYNKTL